MEKISGRLVSAAEASKELAEWRRLQRKNLSILDLLKRVALVPQREQLASMPEPLLPKGKRTEPSSPKHQITRWENPGEREPPLDKRGESERENGEKRVDTPPQRGGAVPDLGWVGSKWLVAFPRVPVTQDIPVHETSDILI